MKVIKYLLNLLKEAAKSRTAKIFFLIQLILIIIALIKRNWLLEPLHPDNESLLLNILTVFNIPAILVTMILCIPLMLIAKELTNLYIFQIVMFFCWMCQWALIGYGLEKLIKKTLSKNQIK